MVASATPCNVSKEEPVDALVSTWFYFEAATKSNCYLIRVEKHVVFSSLTQIFTIPLSLCCQYYRISFSELFSKACVKLIQDYNAAPRFVILSL